LGNSHSCKHEDFFDADDGRSGNIHFNTVNQPLAFFESIMKMPKLLAVLVFIVCIGFIVNAFADDWSRWMGPNRDNVWSETKIIEEFPEGGPPVVWRAEIAGGYAGPAVANGRVFVSDYVTGDDVKIANFERTKSTGIERLICLDESTGKLIWKHEYPVTYAISYPAGPRCTPAVDGDHVYFLGAEGKLVCLTVDKGEVIWDVDLVEKYKTKSALWGYAAHPLIDGDNLITLAGGEGSHVVAFDKKTGQEKWRSQSAPEQGYSPPTIIEAGGTRQLILPQPDAISSVNPDTGELYWELPYEATSGSIIMSPIEAGDYLYIAGYSRKSMLIKLASDKPAAEIEWRDKARDAISPVNVQPFYDKATSVVYGMDQSGDMVALQLPDGKRLWATPEPVSKRRVGSGTAFIVRNADRFFLFNENGELVIAKMTPEGYSEIDRTKVIEPTNLAFGRDVVWSMPAFANRKMFVRNDKEIICLDLEKKP
jgi:outer membrane protein assembly factor BamB